MADPAPATTLVPVPSLLEYLGITDPGQPETQRATICLEAARATLERICGRQFTTTDETRYFDVAVNTTELLVGDFQQATEIAARRRVTDPYEELAPSAWVGRRDGPHRPYRRIRRQDGNQFAQGQDAVRITATWGMVLPDDAELPILMEAAYLYQTNKAPGGPFVNAEGDTVTDVMTRNPAFFSVADNWKVGVVA